MNVVISISSWYLFRDILSIPTDIALSFLISRIFIWCFLVLVFLEVLRVQVQGNNISFLLLSGILFLVAYLLETYSFFLVNSTLPSMITTSKWLFTASQVAITIAPLTFMYFVVTFFKTETTFWEFFPVVFDVALETMYQILGITGDTVVFEISGSEIKYWIYQPPRFWINVVFYISIAWLVGYLTYLIWRSRRVAVEPIVIEQQNIFFIGIFTIFIIAPLVFIVNIFIPIPIIRFFWIAIVSRTFVVAGMTVFIYTYYRSSEKNDFFQPQPLEAFFLLDASSSKIVYSKKFTRDYEWELLEQIVTNVNMINRMLSDALGIKSLITGIDFTDKELFVNPLPQINCIAILILRNQTKVLVDSYQTLLTRIDQSEFSIEGVDGLVQEIFRV